MLKVQMVILISGFFIISCAGIGQKDMSEYGHFVGKTYKTVGRAIVFESECSGWSGKYMLAPPDYDGKCRGALLAEISSGTKFIVQKLIDQNVPLHLCWRVIVSLEPDSLSNKIIADIPACTIWHPQSWIMNHSSTNPRDLNIDPFYALQKLKGS